MRKNLIEIHVDDIVTLLRQLCIGANIEIRPDTLAAYHRALEQEESETGREVLRQSILNAGVSKAQRIPFFARIPVMPLSSMICMAGIFMQKGDVYIAGCGQVSTEGGLGIARETQRQYGKRLLLPKRNPKKI